MPFYDGIGQTQYPQNPRRIIMVNKITVAVLLSLALSGLIIAAQNSQSGQSITTSQPSKQATKPQKPVTNKHKTKSLSVTQQNSRQAYIDPETGELTSEVPANVLENNRAGQINPDATQGDIDEPELEVIDHPNGMQEIRLNGQMNSRYEVELDCSNNIVNKHTNEHHEATPDCDQ